MLDERELQILDAFADLALIAPERRAPDAESDDGRGPREHFHTFLRSLDVEHEGLPGWYADRLLRALHHYGVTELHQGPQLEAALLRLFISQQRQDEQIPVVLALVDDLAAKAPDGDPRLRETLDRLIEATRRRFPVVAAGARAVRHRRFDRPYVERARAEVTAVMRRLAASVAGHRPEDADRAAVDELVACPLPLVPILAEDRLLSGTDEPGALLEVLTRRYYKIRELAAGDRRRGRRAAHELRAPRPLGARLRRSRPVWRPRRRTRRRGASRGVGRAAGHRGR